MLKNESTLSLQQKISMYEEELRPNMERIMELTEEKNHGRIYAEDLKYFDMIEKLDACKEELYSRTKKDEKVL